MGGKKVISPDDPMLAKGPEDFTLEEIAFMRDILKSRPLPCTHFKTAKSGSRMCDLLQNMFSAYAGFKVIRDVEGNVSDYEFLNINVKFEELMGFSSEWVVGRNVSEVFPLLREGGLMNTYDNVVRIEGSTEFSMHSPTFDGYLHIRAIRNGEDRFFVIVDDITLEKKMYDELFDANIRNEYLATHDDNTGLFNMRYFKEEVGRIIYNTKRKDVDYGFALMFIDLDGFKLFNDTFGHGAGDSLLLDVARGLEDSVMRRQDSAQFSEEKRVSKAIYGDFVVRYGGDEFLVFLDGTNDVDHVKVVANRIMGHINGLSYGGVDEVLGCSIGIALYPQHASDLEGVLRAADGAMYTVKNSGKGNIRVYQPGDVNKSKA